jgi:hypothetical protein
MDPQYLAKLQESGQTSPERVCNPCYSDLVKSLNLGQGGVLFAQEKAKEQRRLMLWKSRVNLVKRGRSLMGGKLYSEAAVAYEKYLRILEFVFNCKKGDLLTPTHFKDSARTSELTVVVSVYWDLLRIYDSSDKFLTRQQVAARQLAVFVQFTPIYPDIIKRAESFVRSAKHPQVVKSFLKASVQQRPRCYIATAVFRDPLAPEVQTLRWFRDFYLKRSVLGRHFILLYYRFSPALAEKLDRQPQISWFFRILLSFLARAISCAGRQ